MMTEENRKKPTVVCSVFIERDGKYLFVHDPRFRVWRVPGGRVEYGEIVEETVKREMREELGITITNPSFLGFGQDMQYKHSKGRETCRLLLLFRATTDEELTLDPHEATEHKWVSITEMKNEQEKEGALTDFFKRNPDLQW
ncbi:NUDIX hydrolase [Candidatus Woesearchaeota archaeon]|nr:NUDIX hydrolase [Candidatus Woesearchaeota archaeon]